MTDPRIEFGEWQYTDYGLSVLAELAELSGYVGADASERFLKEITGHDND